jgi:hypothetical protein
VGPERSRRQGAGIDAERAVADSRNRHGGEPATETAGARNASAAPITEAGEVPAATAEPNEARARRLHRRDRQCGCGSAFRPTAGWELYDAGGRICFDVGAANSVRSFTAAAPVRVFLGNADGVARGERQAVVVPRGCGGEM